MSKSKRSRREGRRGKRRPADGGGTPPGAGGGPSRKAVLALAVIVALGAGLAAGFGAMRLFRPGPATPIAPDEIAPPGAVAPPAVVPVFTDVTSAAGVRFRHENGATGKFYYPEVMGAGCAFFDYDGDGFLDIYFVNGNLLPPKEPSPDIVNVLLRNNGDGTFADVTARSGAGDSGYGQGCAAADCDGDGDQDLYVTNYGLDVFFRNKGDGTFERAACVPLDEGWGQSCAFFDADGDGWLDLYVQRYLVYSLADNEPWYITYGETRILDYCSPSGYVGQQDRLFRNRGDGTFEDVTAASGIVAPDGTGMGLACADFTGDGAPDIVVTNDTRPNFFFVNDGRGRFAEEGLVRGAAFNWEGGVEGFMGVEPADYNGDGLLDLAVPCIRTEGFNLFTNLGGSFREDSVAAGIDAATSGLTGFAPVFLDYDRDGDQDLFFTCGEVRMGKTAAGADASFEERYGMRSLLLENRGGRFADVSQFAGEFFGRRVIARACAAGDYDNDGDIDLLVTVLGGEAVLLRNDTAGGNWIGFAPAGNAPNRDAVGARLRLTAGGRTQTHEIFAGGSYLAQRDRRHVFGLGTAAAIASLEVRWPNGATVTYGSMPINRYHVLAQPQ